MSSTVHVFDFDDTLVVTEGSIGVAHFEDGDPEDPVGYLVSHEVPFNEIVEIINYMGGRMAYIRTAGYNVYEEAIRKSVAESALKLLDVGSKPSMGAEDVIDYARAVGLVEAKPLDGVLDIARRASSADEVVGVVTGRRLKGIAVDAVGHECKYDTRRDVQRFLAENGVVVLGAHVHAVGDWTWSTPESKARAIQAGFIDLYCPATLHFYDDNEANLQEVAKLDTPECRVLVHNSKMINDGPAQRAKRASLNAQRRVSETRSHARLRSGAGVR